ncbi:LysR family transcriptional regulator [Aquincola sp. S2]|uniref:LysR family transcriptional regulator n=1 Tax=Pseudaquabacterium terrae TaxID=2732868 RepID=A0ABX2ETU0_9BURK|nr:LysR family transcriptional regulator [Aquabacterium terrae]NRF72063.1 LysR family transcriptional regulator [Aquabacterium terrae]
MNIKTDQRLRITLRQLEVFAATVRAGSTRAAAGRVARSQSAASNALAELEATLGHTLFDRIGRRLVLNENGQALLPHTISLLEQAVEVEALLNAEHQAPLRMASSFTIGEYLLPGLIAQWKLQRPQAQVRLDIANTREVLEAVATFDVDLGFIEGTGSHPDLLVRRWRPDELVAVAAAGHTFGRRGASAKQLAQATWILRERGSGTREVSDRWLTTHLGRAPVGLELGSNEAVKRAVAAGLGIGFLSRHAVTDAVQQGWLVELKTPFPPMRRMLAVVVHRSRRLGSVAQGFLQHCLASTG